ncbi:hypothetical protein [Ochrobactrum soli]|uniref:Uncharacterized protein n=1 Tax=Ochrobactrum soli TaxID=2448455 RepID=A0A2P9HHU5_9HYPH|nr:hypothetical protein [[Ochrobactrum] soli]SPL63691.1 hypothetical protein OHAE_3623 [[Ochrobactrum] soli]
MKNEQKKQTIQDLIAKIIAIGPVDGYRTYKEWMGGKLTFTAEPEADDGTDANLKPFKVDEYGGVYMDNAKVDYEAINKDVGELMQFLDSRIGALQKDVLALSAKVGNEHMKPDGVEASYNSIIKMGPNVIASNGTHSRILFFTDNASAERVYKSLKDLYRDTDSFSGFVNGDAQPTEVPLFDPRKDIGETFSKACKSWTESIAEATGPRSDLAKTIEHLTVCLDPEELYDDLVKSPEFKSAIVDALCRGSRTVHIKL